MSRSRPQPPETSADREAGSARIVVYILFVLIALVALDVPLYNRVDPAMYGVPFFYWFQAAWIVVTAGATFVAYRLKV